jgi:hypothetical protein
VLFQEVKIHGQRNVADAFFEEVKRLFLDLSDFEFGGCVLF